MKIPYIMTIHYKINEIFKLEINKLGIENSDIIELCLYKDSIEEIEDYLIKIGMDRLFNFVLVLKKCYKYIDFGNINEIEEKLYEDLTEIERKWIILKNFQIITENCVNELISKKEYLYDNYTWVVCNLDKLYYIDLNHIEISKDKIKKILPRTKEEKVALKIIKYNIIISTIERCGGIYLYNKMKKDIIVEEIYENVNFTKGYSVCFSPEMVNIIRNYRYPRKWINKKPNIVEEINNKCKKCIEALKNDSYSKPIWINSIKEEIIEKSKIINKELLYKSYDTKRLIKIINKLNTQELNTDEWIINKIYDIMDNKKIDKSLITKPQLKFYIVEKEKEFEELMEDELQNQSMINSIGSLELIRKQIKENKEFYIDYRMDSRMRIYCWSWPVNYQLNHIVRCSIQIKSKENIEEVWKKLWNEETILKYKEYKNFLITDKISEETKNKIIEEFEIKWDNEIEKKIKIESIVIILIKLTTKDVRNTEDKIKKALSIYREFIEDDLNKNLNKWLEVTGLKKKKFMYLIHIQKCIIDAKKNIFKNTLWSDASSNAVQLISLRLGSFNEKLMMLTNIIDNETEYENIYEYIYKKIINNVYTKTINNKLIKKDIIKKITNYDTIKYLIMPSCYGMGKRTFIKNLDKLIDEKGENEWEVLKLNEKKLIGEMIWEIVEKELKEIEFNIDSYKEICKRWYSGDNEIEGFCWKNDLDMVICPINIKESKRSEIRNRLNKAKLKLNETLEEKKRDKLKKEIEDIKKKLVKDDKKFWKRTMVKTKKNNIYARIYIEGSEVEKHKTRIAVVPNTIHTYDASIMMRTIEICDKIGINLLPIHDSIGGTILETPIIKIIFKIVNIEMIEKASKNPPFPIKEPIKFDKKIIQKIIESRDFFR